MIAQGKKLKDIIEYLDSLQSVKIIQMNVSLVSDEAECIYNGSVLNVPWYMVDYYLANDSNGEAISACIDDNNQPYFEIYVVEDLDRLT